MAWPASFFFCGEWTCFIFLLWLNWKKNTVIPWPHPSPLVAKKTPWPQTPPEKTHGPQTLPPSPPPTRPAARHVVLVHLHHPVAGVPTLSTLRRSSSRLPPTLTLDAAAVVSRGVQGRHRPWPLPSSTMPTRSPDPTPSFLWSSHLTSPTANAPWTKATRRRRPMAVATSSMATA
jgi:hypothetical protein